MNNPFDKQIHTSLNELFLNDHINLNLYVFKSYLKLSNDENQYTHNETNLHVIFTITPPCRGSGELIPIETMIYSLGSGKLPSDAWTSSFGLAPGEGSLSLLELSSTSGSKAGSGECG